jgi:hypothetical protein
MKKLTDAEKEIISKYGHLFNNTGGNDIVELIERDGVSYFNNVIVAEMQGCLYSQVCLIKRLIAEGFLK